MGALIYFDQEDVRGRDFLGFLEWKEDFTGKIDSYEGGYNMPVRHNLFLTKGDTKTYRIYVKDRDLNIISLEDAYAVFTVKEKESDEDGVIEKSTAVESEGEIVSPGTGMAAFFFNPSDTLGLEVTQYVFDVKVIYNSGSTYTVAEGTLTLQN